MSNSAPEHPFAAFKGVLTHLIRVGIPKSETDADKLIARLEAAVTPELEKAAQAAAPVAEQGAEQIAQDVEHSV